MKTVAFIDDRALGVATLVALACNDIVFRKGARMGDVRQLVTGRHGQVQDLDRARRSRASPSGRPTSPSRRAIPSPWPSPWSIPTPWSSRPRTATTGAVGFVLQSQVEADPGRYLEPARSARRPARS